MYALVVCVGYSFVSYLFNSWLVLQSFLFQKFSSLTLKVKKLELGVNQVLGWHHVRGHLRGDSPQGVGRGEHSKVEQKKFLCLQVIEIPFSELPEGEEVLTILGQESAPLHLWVTLAVEYYRCVNLTVNSY